MNWSSCREVSSLMMGQGSLRFWDLPSWHADRSYSPLVADALRQAYVYLFQDELTASKLRAHATVQPYLDEPMSEHQRLRVYYLLGVGFAADGQYAFALFCLDEALERVTLLGSPADEVEIYTLKASINRAALEFTDAVDDCRIAVSLLREERQRTLSPNLSQELQLLGQMAGLEFFLTRFADSQRHVDEGFALAAQANADSLAYGALHASQAHLDQLRGDHQTALDHAELAAQAYQRAGLAVSSGRLRCLCADILARHADVLVHCDERDSLVARATHHIGATRQLLAETSDDIGVGLSELVDLRLSRLASRNEDRVARLEQVGKLARKWDDSALLVQMFTSLGDELAASGSIDSAKHRYREAIALMDGGEAPALTIWPRRSLLRYSEMDD